MAQTCEKSYDDDADSIALAGIGAVERLIAERNNLRQLTEIEERKIASLRAANEDLETHLSLIRESYLKLALEFITQLQTVDDTINQLVHKRCDSKTPSES